MDWATTSRAYVYGITNARAVNCGVVQTSIICRGSGSSSYVGAYAISGSYAYGCYATGGGITTSYIAWSGNTGTDADCDRAFIAGSSSSYYSTSNYSIRLNGTSTGSLNATQLRSQSRISALS